MSHITPGIQAHIADGVSLVNALLARPQVPFQGRTIEAPDESGIYLFSDRRTNEHLYVGQTGKGIKSRLKDHWDGNASSDMTMRLVEDGVVENTPKGKEWIMHNVAVRWLKASELDTCLNWAEHFAIAVIRPKFNR